MEEVDYFRFALAMLFVLSLIGLLAWLGRRMKLVPGATVRAGGARHLNVIEVAAIDARRRLVLIRRDGREHLLLLGANSETVVERDIPPSDAKVVALPKARDGQ